MANITGAITEDKERTRYSPNIIFETTNDGVNIGRDITIIPVMRAKIIMLQMANTTVPFFPRDLISSVDLTNQAE